MACKTHETIANHGTLLEVLRDALGRPGEHPMPWRAIQAVAEAGAEARGCSPGGRPRMDGGLGMACLRRGQQMFRRACSCRVAAEIGMQRN